LSVEWHQVRIPPLPAWDTLIMQTAHSEPGLVWQRQRDVMPGYAFGLEDTLMLRRLTSPPGMFKTGLRGLDATSLVWFDESIQRKADDPNDEAFTLPPARYALAGPAPYRVVYGEQCLSRSLCLSWQTWPVSSAR
jgi:hypothetical protein